jgi:glucokinase
MGPLQVASIAPQLYNAAMQFNGTDTNHLYILAGDIGGTNTSLALVRDDEGQFSIRSRRVYPTQELSSLSEAIRDALEAFRAELGSLDIQASCLSIAGPVVDNRCVPTNISWSLDGREIEKEFGFRTLVINDFTAICYGIPLLNPDDPSELTPLPHPGGTSPIPTEYLPGVGVQAVVGAGTGLGVGYLIAEQSRILALPAEGGHVDYAPFDDITLQLRNWMAEKLKEAPEPEMFISGIGIANLFRFMREARNADSEILRRIEELPDAEKPQAISAAADEDETCAQIMTMLVRMYARVAHNLALGYIPKKGLFLAGGIAAKNKRWFLEDDRFMKAFLHNYQPTIRPVLDNIPVYIVEDYKISLYGAAHAFVQLTKFIHP